MQPDGERTAAIAAAQERNHRREAEADRAPGDVDAVAQALHDAVCDFPWESGSDAHREAYLDHAQHALAALRSEQGQSRDDTVTLAEAVRQFLSAWWEFDSLQPQQHYDAVSERVEVLDDALARLGAGRAEGEDRDTENER